MKILIILILIITYLGVGFIYAFVGEIFLYIVRVEIKNSGEEPYSEHPLLSFKKRFKRVFL